MDTEIIRNGDAKKPKKRNQTSVDTEKRYATQGDFESQHKLGIRYLYGIGVEQSAAEAFKYFKLAADQDYNPSLVRLGFMYLDGVGVGRDKDAAVVRFKVAAWDGCLNAQIILGLIFEHGDLYVLGNMERAWRYYKMAAKQGSQDAQNKVEWIEDMADILL